MNMVSCFITSESCNLNLRFKIKAANIAMFNMHTEKY